MNKRLTMLLLLALLATPACGFGQQQPAAGFASLVAEAQQAQVAQNYSAARNAYQQAVRIEPNMAELWANLGLMQRQAGDDPGAMVSFQHANRLKPSLYVPNLFLGIGNLKQGKAPEAIPYLVKAAKMNTSDPQVHLALGRAYFAVRKYSESAAELDQATRLDPKLGTAWFSLGIARLNEVEDEARVLSGEAKTSPFAGALYAESLHKQGRFGEAASLYKTLLDSQPQPPCLRSELGFSLLRGHDQSGAVTQFAAERAAHPGCGLASLGQARMAMDSGDNAQAVRQVEELWQRDRGYLESNAAVLVEGLPGEKAAVVTTYFSSLAEPDSPSGFPADLREALMRAFAAAGLDAGPNSAASASAGATPKPVPATAGSTTEELYTAGKFQQCERRLHSAASPLSADKLKLLAACSFFAGDNQSASSAADLLKALQPHSVEALYWSIQANERLAFKALSHFQEMEPDSARSHVLLGDIYHQLERNDDAQTEYGKALALSPNDTAAMLGLATAYLSNNNNEAAGEITTVALVRSPEDPELNLIMAEVKLAHNQFAEAIPYLEKSLRAKPQMLPRVHALMGKAFAETGRTEEAIEQLKMGVSSDEEGSVQYLLARLYRQVGDTKDAAAALERMKEIKQQRRARGVKQVEDPDLSPLESPPTAASTP